MKIESTMATVCFVVCLFNVSQAEDFTNPFDHFRASELATQRSEARQRDAVARQLTTIDEMKWWSGLPTLRQPAPPSLDYLYAYGPQLAQRNGRSSFIDVFEPWPYVPGDIWGYQWYRPTRQPLHRIEVQFGPNRWESHPVYGPIESHKLPSKKRTTGPREF